MLDHVQQLQLYIVAEDQDIKYRQQRKTITREEVKTRYDNINNYKEAIKLFLAILRREISLDLIIVSQGANRQAPSRPITDIALLAPLPLGFQY